MADTAPTRTLTLHKSTPSDAARAADPGRARLLEVSRHALAWAIDYATTVRRARSTPSTSSIATSGAATCSPIRRCSSASSTRSTPRRPPSCTRQVSDEHRPGSGRLHEHVAIGRPADEMLAVAGEDRRRPDRRRQPRQGRGRAGAARLGRRARRPRRELPGRGRQGRLSGGGARATERWRRRPGRPSRGGGAPGDRAVAAGPRAPERRRGPGRLTGGNRAIDRRPCRRPVPGDPSPALRVAWRLTAVAPA